LDEEFGFMVKQGYDDILENTTNQESMSYLLNYDGFQYDVGLNSSLSLISSNQTNSSKVGYIQCNSHIQICEVNDVIMEKFGYKNEIFSMKWYDLIHPSYRKMVKEFIENILQKKEGKLVFQKMVLLLNSCIKCHFKQKKICLKI
jgi:PAS domain-containing protein